jgi:hypothetical protein
MVRACAGIPDPDPPAGPGCGRSPSNCLAGAACRLTGAACAELLDIDTLLQILAAFVSVSDNSTYSQTEPRRRLLKPSYLAQAARRFVSLTQMERSFCVCISGPDCREAIPEPDQRPALADGNRAVVRLGAARCMPLAAWQ